MTDEERIKILRDALHNVWCGLGCIVLDTPEPLPPLIEKIGSIADEVSEALNDADPELEYVHGPSRGLYISYQPLEVLRFIRKMEAESIGKPKIEAKELPEYEP